MNMNGLLNGQAFFARILNLNLFLQGPVVLKETNFTASHSGKHCFRV